MKKQILVHKVGENPGFCAEYYKSAINNRYVKVTHPKTKEIEWLTASSLSWEPEYPINLETNEITACTDCTSINNEDELRKTIRMEEMRRTIKSIHKQADELFRTNSECDRQKVEDGLNRLLEHDRNNP